MASTLESLWKSSPGSTAPQLAIEEDAKWLVRDAIAADIFNDLGSGSNIDLCVITKGRVDYLRPHDMANKKGVRTGNYKYKRGTTGVLTKAVTKLDLEVVEETIQTMDTS
ncbi:proteasome subunit beta type-7-like [Oncorhynchus mykiss]|uniref:proteasome subunit beta type-7-like n=1 Tax=Oncorhynchus mykiss TaxID=8022 RepID=UPI001878BC25|nr:proteasome subunit beta type-7-like [Oncorhynchus mykiss]